MDDDLPTEYDVIVVGTGLVESIVAAACSRIGKKVLHLDTNSYYGHLWSTFNLESFEQWIDKTIDGRCGPCEVCASEQHYKYYSTVNNGLSLSGIQWEWNLPEDSDDKQPEVRPSLNAVSENSKNDHIVWTKKEIKKRSQKFNIDLSPKIIFSKGPMVELLIKSGVSRYTEFISVHNVLLYINSDIKPVPYSKSDIFSTRSVSVVHKRILMKLLQEIQNFNNELSEHEHESFYEYLKSFNIPEIIENYILYSICRVSKNASYIEGIKSAQIFLNSLGVYGNSPFLWPLYGSSELIQAFCRLCAVFGGIYCLNRSVDQILVDEEDKCIGILSRNKKLIADHVVMSSSQTPAEFFLENKFRTISRGVFITNKSLYSSGRNGASLLQFPSNDPSSPPVTVIELDGSTLACPNGLYLVHLLKNGTDDYKEFDRIRQELFEPYQKQGAENDELSTETMKPSILFKLYFNITQNHSEPSKIKPTNFYSCTGPSEFELDFFSSLQEAETIFRQMFPNEEFLPTPNEPSAE